MLIRNGKNKYVPSGSESMASMRELFSTYLGGLTGSRKSIVHTRSISSKMEEKECKESDSLVVPMKPVMTVEGRGGHTNRSHGEPSEVITLLNLKLVGHYRYYGISEDYEGLMKFYRFIVSTLYQRLTRRSQRAYLSWKRYKMLL